jgi:hypothetical protein
MIQTELLAPCLPYRKHTLNSCSIVTTFSISGDEKTPPLLSFKTHLLNWAWWYIPVISAFRRLRQEDHEFKANLGYIMNPYLKKQQQRKMHLSSLLFR